MALAPAIEVIDKRFYRYVIHNAHIDHLWTGARWAEGPVYVPAGRYLLFSDIPNDRTLRYDELSGRSTCSKRRPTTRTDTASIARAGWSAASTGVGR